MRLLGACWAGGVVGGLRCMTDRKGSEVWVCVGDNNLGVGSRDEARLV